MIGFIIALVFIVSLYNAVKFVHKIDIDQQAKFQASLVPVRACPPHDWSVHPATEKLTCCVCNQVAGS